MLFDKLAGFIERHIPDMVPDLEQTALFEFPFRAHEAVAPGKFCQDDLEHFFLPFPRTAIEDKATCTFLFDGTEKQVGLSEPRAFIDVLSLAGSDDPGAFKGSLSELDPEMRQWARQEGLHQIALGRIFSMKLPVGSTDYQASACVDRIVIVNGRGEIQSDMTMQELKLMPGAEESCRGIIGNVITSIEELMLINSDPEYFIFEKSPVKPRKSKAGRITRSPNRPRYVPLKPETIRKTMGLNRPSEDGVSGKRPHERRRHWRLLKSERFKNKQGQRVMVDACWVGPSEAVVGKTRYRVRLDI
jgi:hypothetical protein